MSKTAQNEWYRLFLIERLPEPLTPASSHLQLFDNYIPSTRMRLRKIRDPYTKAWSWTLQQRIHHVDDEYPVSKLSEIHLDESEYSIFAHFEGREIRKNRYFHEFDQTSFTFDVYLGALFGLSTARVDFDSNDRLVDFEPPNFALFDVTGDSFFDGDSLVNRAFSEIQDHVAGMAAAAPAATQEDE
jgi:CYTH domain-containing protein